MLIWCWCVAGLGVGWPGLGFGLVGLGVGPVVGGFGGVWGLGERPVGGFVVQSERGEAGDVVGCG